MRKFECKKQDCPYKRCYVELDETRIVKCLNGWTGNPQWNELLEKSEQLPKLTVEALKERGIEWPVWAKIAVVNADGSGAFGDSHIQGIYLNKECFGSVIPDAVWTKIPGGKWDNTDWRNSPMERPAAVKFSLTTELPEWCRVGEWVYNFDGDYFCMVTEVSEKDRIFYAKRPGMNYTIGCGDFNYGFSKWKPARLRRWNKDEMRQQAGKTFVLNGYNAVCLVATGTKLFFLDTMGLRHCLLYSSETIKFWRNTMLDGSPCGVLEVVE